MTSEPMLDDERYGLQLEQTIADICRNNRQAMKEPGKLVVASVVATAGAFATFL